MEILKGSVYMRLQPYGTNPSLHYTFCISAWGNWLK